MVVLSVPCPTRALFDFLAFFFLRAGTFRLQKVKKQRERLKTKARKGIDEEEDKTLKHENPPPTPSVFFFFHFYYKIGEIEILTFF